MARIVTQKGANVCSLPLVWIVWCLLVRALFLLRPLERWADAAVIAAGLGLLLTSRLYPALRNIEVPSVASGAICAATVGVLVALARFVPARAMAGGAMLAVAWLAGTAFFALRSGHERAAPVAVSASASAPNVLLIFLDTVRYDDAQQMPNLTKLASTGVVYDRAWASAPWTLPSHLGVLTGMPPWKVPYDSASHRFLYDGPTLAERFASRGYTTAAIFANPYLGPDPLFHRGFQHFHVSARCVPCLSGLAVLRAARLDESIRRDGEGSAHHRARERTVFPRAELHGCALALLRRAGPAGPVGTKRWACSRCRSGLTLRNVAPARCRVNHHSKSHPSRIACQ